MIFPPKQETSPYDGQRDLNVPGPPIAALPLVRVMVGIVQAFSMGRQLFSRVLCGDVSTPAVVLAMGPGAAFLGDVTVFSRAEEDRLFVADARRLSSRGEMSFPPTKGSWKPSNFCVSLP